MNALRVSIHRFSSKFEQENKDENKWENKKISSNWFEMMRSENENLESTTYYLPMLCAVQDEYEKEAKEWKIETLNACISWK